jgi:hypothetical protein
MCKNPARWTLGKRGKEWNDLKEWHLCTNCAAKAAHIHGIQHRVFNPEGIKK